MAENLDTGQTQQHTEPLVDHLMTSVEHQAPSPSRPVTASFSFPNGQSSPSNPPLSPSAFRIAAQDQYLRRSPSSLRRSPSTQSLASTSSTSTLRKKTSMSSIQDTAGGRSPRSSTSVSRRSSYGGLMNKPPPVEPYEPPPPPTPAMVAREFFKRDLEAHQEQEVNQLVENRINGEIPQKSDSSPTAAVILHDACYGHRYSRPRTSKASLSTIVERPERIGAIVLGISTAYVLLGDRHSAGSNPPHPKRTAGAMPFLIHKSSRRVPLTTLAVTNVHGSAWMTELQEMCLAAEAKLTSTGKELVRPRGDTTSSGEDKPRLHEGDLYLCAESLEAFEGALGGVLDAVDMVFSLTGPRRCFACVRPPGHHCSSDYPSGFCWLNNIHVGISYGASSHGLTHAAIFDFDLHHGDGSQSVTWAHNAKVSTLPKNASLSRKTKIGYFSLHDINSYPCEWGDEDKVRNASLCLENAHGQTIWNVHLQPWETKQDFWRLYAERYSVLLTKMSAFLRAQHQKFLSLGHSLKSKGAIFISAGFDASEWEGHGMQRHEVNVPTDFYARVTRDIIEMSKEPGLGVDGRVVSVLEGGYSDRALASGALSHMCGLTSSPHGREEGLVDKVANESLLAKSTANQSSSVNGSTRSALPYRNEWWTKQRLDELENVAYPKPVVPTARKPRGGPAPTYQTPTQSFVAKVVSPPTYQRSISGSAALRQSSGPSIVSRPPTPPPPEVDWTVASQELAQLLIPQDRTTTSCKHEDLNVKATEARKNRQSLVGAPSDVQVPVDDFQKMQLRDRKTKQPVATPEEPRPDSRASAGRRRTVGGAELNDAVTTRDSRRRVSVAPTILSNSDDSSTGRKGLPLDDISVAKQRAPAKPRAPRKATTKPPIPRVPSGFKKETSQEPTQTVTTPASAPSAEKSTDADLANLASGVKKLSIKLNVPSREEYESREAKKSTATRAPRKAAAVKKPTKETANVTTKVPAPKLETQVKAIPLESTAPTPPDPPAPESKISPQPETTQPPPIPNSIPLTSILNDPPTISPPHPPAQQAPPTFQPPESSSLTTTTATAPMPGIPDFPMDGVDPPVIPTSPLQEPQLPTTNTASAPASTFSSPKPAKHNLPMFTANGHIPFSSPPRGKGRE